MWYLNLRKILSKDNWNKLSLKVRKEQNFTCFCCNINNKIIPNNKFHCHEAWWFNDKEKNVSLKALLCVCELCHNSIHLGRCDNKNAFKRIMNINKWNYEITKAYVDSEFEIWSKRSNIKWTIDIESFKCWLNEDDFLIVKKFFNNCND